jgi:hypothetical protein
MWHFNGRERGWSDTAMMETGFARMGRVMKTMIEMMKVLMKLKRAECQSMNLRDWSFSSDFHCSRLGKGTVCSSASLLHLKRGRKRLQWEGQVQILMSVKVASET